MLKRIGRSRRVQHAAGAAIAAYLSLVFRTSRFEVDPPDGYERVDAAWPPIIAIWHGQHFLLASIRRPHQEFRVLISRHRDGEINAVAAERLGVTAIRGSGDTRRRTNTKGGATGFRTLLKTLDQGIGVALTADVPKVSRKAGLGIVTLAQKSGRPIVPVAIATSRRKVLNTWDRTSLDRPFSRGIIAFGEHILVPADADDDALEAARLRVEESLNEATERAERSVGVRR
ncbi:lysophospholipid acyltransferase family protein [Lutibaculum baratangense]|uniref:DUF374 domain-containing protein n=1 Tax=Lutibaculum baratangense AMV1 TaxID=631454 RepID=V4RP48_9HYPH|nr:lysophospholipid acyltransferase family protein [Lutibaculum baratangense]ESR24955.1 Protein of unknown function DUF374 [Lutibaculum baratangense AMV1]